jgi:hypothetical protein
MGNHGDLIKRGEMYLLMGRTQMDPHPFQVFLPAGHSAKNGDERQGGHACVQDKPYGRPL